jgi:hypothetical protein
VAPGRSLPFLLSVLGALEPLWLGVEKSVRRRPLNQSVTDLSSPAGILPKHALMGAATDTAALRPLNAGGAGEKSKPSGGLADGGSVLRAIKFIAALALIPLCAGLAIGIHDHINTLWNQLKFAVFGPGPLLRHFFAGAVFFGGVTILLWRPVVVYVFAHEAVHALATWLCLGKVSNLTASAKGGQVTSSKSNTFIRLAPYCVPLYALLAAGVYAALNAWWRPMTPYANWLCFVLGIFYSFHIGFTLWSLRRDQPDFKPDGWLFSLALIFLANALVFALLMGFVLEGSMAGGVSALKMSAMQGWQQTLKIYGSLGANINALIR